MALSEKDIRQINEQTGLKKVNVVGGELLFYLTHLDPVGFGQVWWRCVMRMPACKNPSTK